ncbi:MAG: helix-turn-helix transcriptional regulator [Bdellovibrionales bacterium]
MKKTWATAINETAKRQGNLLRKVRESTNLTMRQLAMQVGISHTAISQLENGKLDLPRARVEQIVIACGYKVEDFNKLLGVGSVVIDYRSECRALLNDMDEDCLKLMYGVMSRMRGAANKSEAL